MAEWAGGFDEYVAERGPALLRFAYLLTGDRQHAEDLVQDVLVKVCRRWQRHGIADHPDAYVRRALVNEHVSRRRRRSSREIVGAVDDRAYADGGDGVDEIVERDRMWRALERLPRRQRAVLVLRYYEALPDADIARALGCAEATVRSLASRAFEVLRRDRQLQPESETTARREEP